jgi:hypothetical protein
MSKGKFEALFGKVGGVLYVLCVAYPATVFTAACRFGGSHMVIISAQMPF